MKQKLPLLILAVVIAAALGYFFLFNGSLKASGERPALPAQLEPTSSAPVVDEGEEAPAVVLADVDAAPLPLSQRFEQSRDLRAFVADLRSAYDAGDPDARWWTYRTYEYCKGYTTNPAYFTRDTERTEGFAPEVATAWKASRERLAAKCSGFQPSEVASIAALAKMLADANEAGSVAAAAQLFANQQVLLAAQIGGDNKGAFSESEARKLIERVAQSGDPQAFLSISSAMGMPSLGRDRPSNEVSGSEEAMYAWQLAACKRGLDCSAQGALMTQYCANGGICGPYNDLRGLIFDGLVPRGEAARIEKLINQVLHLKGA